MSQILAFHLLRPTGIHLVKVEVDTPALLGSLQIYTLVAALTTGQLDSDRIWMTDGQRAVRRGSLCYWRLGYWEMGEIDKM